MPSFDIHDCNRSKYPKNHLSTPSNIDLIRFFCSVYNPRLTKNCNRYHLPHWVVSVQIRLVVQSRRNTVIVHFSQPTFQSNLTKTCTRSLGALCLLIRIYQNYGSLQLQWQRLSWQIMEFQVNKWRKKIPRCQCNLIRIHGNKICDKCHNYIWSIE